RKWEWFKCILSYWVWLIGKHMFSYKVKFHSTNKNKLESEVISILNQSIPGENAIFAAHPHGLLAISSIIFLLTPDSYWQNLVPFIHRSVFNLPFLRDLALWIGALDADL